MLMEVYTHFLDMLDKTVNSKKDKVFATCYNGKAKPTNKYTFQEIWDEAGVIAHDLRIRNKLNKGDRVSQISPYIHWAQLCRKRDGITWCFRR